MYESWCNNVGVIIVIGIIIFAVFTIGGGSCDTSRLVSIVAMVCIIA